MYSAPVVVFGNPLDDTVSSIWLSKTDIKIARRIAQNFLPHLFGKVTNRPAFKHHWHSSGGTTLKLYPYTWNNLQCNHMPEQGYDLVATGNRVHGKMIGATIRALKFLVGAAVPGAMVSNSHQGGGAGVFVMLPTGMTVAASLAAILTEEKSTNWIDVITLAATADQADRQRIMSAAEKSPGMDAKQSALDL